MNTIRSTAQAVVNAFLGGYGVGADKWQALIYELSKPAPPEPELPISVLERNDGNVILSAITTRELIRQLESYLKDPRDARNIQGTINVLRSGLQQRGLYP